MPLYTGPIASKYPDTDHDLYSKECMQVIRDQLHGKIVTWGFKGDAIGEVVRGSITDEEYVYALIKLYQDIDKDKKVYAVIAFSHTSNDYVENEDGGRNFHNLTIMGVGLTTDPADERLTPIQKFPE
jgi:hypothetical protein